MKDDCTKDELADTPHSAGSQRRSEIEQMSGGEARALVHELHVHQAELESQNEELLQIHRELELSRRHYSDLFEHAPVGYLIVDDAAIVHRVNQTFLEMVGAGVEAIRRRPLASWITDEDRSIFYARQRSLFRGDWRRSLTLWMQRSSGEPFFVKLEARLAPPLDLKETGDDQRLLLVAVNDITEQKSAEEALESSRESLAVSEAKHRRLSQELSVLFEAIPDRLALHGSDHELQWVNANWAEALGLTVDEVIGRRCHELLGEEEPCSDCPVTRAYHTGQLEQGVLERPGSKIYDVRAAPLLDEDGRVTGIIEIARDITEARALEEQLQHAQKMESLGRLAGGIAHDFNNLLTGISGNVSLALMDLEPDSELGDLLGEVTDAADRAAQLTQQLLAFSRKQVVRKLATDVNLLIVRMETLLERVIGEDLILETELAPDLPTLKLDPTQFEQIIVNLVVNARDAMRSGGRLRLTTRDVVVDHEFLLRHPQVTAPRYVAVAVSDSGTGIPSAVRPHIFEPFFTTKEVGKGTGLGLSMVYGLVSQHEGIIDVESVAGEGTTFTIYFPVEQKPSVVPVRNFEPLVEMPRGHGTVLVVEDDARVLMLVSKILQRLGYQVIEAASVQRALELFRNNEGVEVVITDVIMPEMHGGELARAMVELRPETKILFMSGYSESVLANRGVLEQGHRFIRKPFVPTELARAVHLLFSRR